MKLGKILLMVITTLLVSWLFYSCSKDDNLENLLTETAQQHNSTTAQQHNSTTAQLYEESNSESEEYIVLGEKRVNPFTIEHINQAKDNLYGASMPDKLPTHGYYKFLPESQDHLAELLEWELSKNIALFDFPLEYEIFTEGDIYIDPAISDSLLTYQYATIPVEIELPSIPFEKIDDLFIDKSDPFLLAQSFWQTGNLEDLIEYTFQGGLTESQVDDYKNNVGANSFLGDSELDPPNEPCPPGYEWEMVPEFDDYAIDFIWVCVPVTPPPPPATNDCDCPIPSNIRKPAGCVRVDDTGVMEGVQIATIKIKDSWFGSDNTTTDVAGCWSINKGYAGKIKVWVRFINDNVKVKDQKYRRAIWAVKDYIGKFKNPPFNNISVDYGSSFMDNESNERMYWAAAHTLNTVNDYRTRAAADGVPLPKLGLNWINQSGTQAASAAMLQGIVFSSYPSFFAFTNVNLQYITSIYFLPDITNQYGPNEDTGRFNGTGYHELGHASHYSLVGESYWFNYRNHIIFNGGYGSFGNFNPISHPGHIALGEAVGNFTGSLYGNTPDGGEGNEWNLDEDTRDNFIPQGLMHDLGDDTPFANDIITDPNTGFTEQDNVIGFTPNMIFNGLTPNVTSIRDFRDRLRELHLSDTPNNITDYNALLDVYDVFN